LTIINSIRLLFFKKKIHKELAILLGYIPRKWEIYKLAFTHRSASVLLPDGRTVNNERLEFLGDAVLDAVIADYLFFKYQYEDEGFLSKMRSKIVKRKHLNSLAIKVGLKKLIISNSINSNGGKHIYGNAFEALVGAVYLDKGYDKTRKFIIEKILDDHIDLEELEHRETDYKSRIIEWAQKNKTEISFDSQEEYSGHDRSPIFVSSVMVAGKIMGQGKGASKKEAEQNAAELAFNEIDEV
jgi:ribonuclease III